MASSKIKSDAWKSLGTAEGTATITLPNDFNELYVDVRVYLNSGGWANGFTFSFCRAMLENTAVVYRQGYSFSTAGNLVNLAVSKTSVQITYAVIDGAQVSAKAHVYYR